MPPCVFAAGQQFGQTDLLTGAPMGRGSARIQTKLAPSACSELATIRNSLNAQSFTQMLFCLESARFHDLLNDWSFRRSSCNPATRRGCRGQRWMLLKPFNTRHVSKTGAK